MCIYRPWHSLPGFSVVFGNLGELLRMMNIEYREVQCSVVQIFGFYLIWACIMATRLLAK